MQQVASDYFSVAAKNYLVIVDRYSGWPVIKLCHGEIAQELGKGKIVVMNLCGRGDKDIFTVAEALGRKI